MLDRLLNAAEVSIRLRGYHAVSFRELADELGIKSSSVHYYFRQKEDLGVSLVERYAERFFAALELEAETAKTTDERLRAYCQVYRQALQGADSVCLCGMLGAESCGLPAALSESVAAFFQANLKWLEEALSAELPAAERRQRAIHILATLQGAMMLAKTMNDTQQFDQAVEDLLSGH